MADDQPRIIHATRSAARGGVAGAAAVAAPADAADGTVTPAAAAAARRAAGATTAATAREAFETLTAAEADLLEAIVARLIPTDAHGPGATEARAARYIDRALGGALAVVAPGLRVRPRGARSLRADRRAASRSSSCRRPIRIRC